MTRNKIIANRIREVLLNGHWIANTNYKKQLQSITWKLATQKIGNLNSIAMLAYHVNYYLAGLIVVFQGGQLAISDKYSFNLPQIESENDWQKLLEEFLSNAELFAAEVEKMEDNKLDAVFVKEEYGTYLRNIEGVIEHSYYHLGQISLIKKMVLEGGA